MTPLKLHQARLLAWSIRYQCKSAIKHLNAIQSSGYGDPASAITEHARKIGQFRESLETILKGR